MKGWTEIVLNWFLFVGLAGIFISSIYAVYEGTDFVLDV